MPDNETNAYPVLLAGGSGTRLWPVSRERFPKQMVRFFGGQSLIQATINRLFPVFEPEHLRVVCGAPHVHHIERDMRELDIPNNGKIISEPCGRNTAPAILLAALQIVKTEKTDDAVIFIFPADHVIGDVTRFQDRVRDALDLALRDVIVTFGITPHYPETGYGYIEAADTAIGNGFRLRRFVEKPDADTARQYVDSGRYYWNSGMFAFKASVVIEEFGKHKPEMLNLMESFDFRSSELDAETYARLENISVDYAIMEHTERGAVLPSDFGWSDIGSWKALYDFLEKDENGNVVSTGDVILQQTADSLVMGQDRLVALNNVSNIVVVETPDAVLVSGMENSQDVKTIVDKLKRSGRPQYQAHMTTHHKWGYRKILEDTQGLTVRRIGIYSGAEMPGGAVMAGNGQWFVMQGSGRLFYNGSVRDLTAPQSCRIPGAGFQRLKNTGGNELQLVEVINKM